MNQSLNLTESLEKMKSVIGKTHYIFLFLFMIGVIAITGLSVSNMLNSSSNISTSTVTSPTATENFTKDPTLPKINSLEFSSNDSNISLPTGQRLNPFSE